MEAIVLAYGRCGNGLLGVRAGRVPLILPQAHDCISILLGGKERHDALLRENPGTYFYSPGWVRERRVPGPDREAYLRELYHERFEDDPEMIDDLVEADQEMFAHHNCAAYVSVIDAPSPAPTAATVPTTSAGSTASRSAIRIFSTGYSPATGRMPTASCTSLRANRSVPIKTATVRPTREVGRIMNAPPRLQIRTGSDERTIPLPESATGSLADWLAENGYPLNTRCGGRGICRGCRVVLNGETLRACQLPLRQTQRFRQRSRHSGKLSPRRKTGRSQRL